MVCRETPGAELWLWGRHLLFCIDGRGWTLVHNYTNRPQGTITWFYDFGRRCGWLRGKGFLSRRRWPFRLPGPEVLGGLEIKDERQCIFRNGECIFRNGD